MHTPNSYKITRIQRSSRSQRYPVDDNDHGTGTIAAPGCTRSRPSKPQRLPCATQRARRSSPCESPNCATSRCCGCSFSPMSVPFGELSVEPDWYDVRWSFVRTIGTNGVVPITKSGRSSYSSYSLLNCRLNGSIGSDGSKMSTVRSRCGFSSSIGPVATTERGWYQYDVLATHGRKFPPRIGSLCAALNLPQLPSGALERLAKRAVVVWLFSRVFQSSLLTHRVRFLACRRVPGPEGGPKRHLDRAIRLQTYSLADLLCSLGRCERPWLDAGGRPRDSRQLRCR